MEFSLVSKIKWILIQVAKWNANQGQNTKVPLFRISMKTVMGSVAHRGLC